MDVDAKAIWYDWNPSRWISSKCTISLATASGPRHRRENQEQCKSCLKSKSHPSDHKD